MADSTFGSGLDFGGDASAAVPAAPNSGNTGPAPAVQPATPAFGSAFGGPNYTPPDPSASPLDQSADTLQQRIKRANEIATNPLLQIFNPEGVNNARQFVGPASEQLQKIRQQQADIKAGRVQAQTLGLAPGEVPDEATQADRIAVAQGKALKGDLNAFKGLSAVAPEAAGAIQDQVHQAASAHLSNAQLAFDSLSSMQNPGQYNAKVAQLRKDGTLGDLEALGLKVPQTFEAFNASKTVEGEQLRQARVSLENLGARIAERTNGTPMEKKEAETYDGRLTTSYGDTLSNGNWERINGKRVYVVNGQGNINDLGTKFSYANADQRKSIKEQFDGAVPKEDVEKYRAFNRTYQLATTDPKGNPIGDGKVNTNPNVQQGMAEGLASMLRGGSGGANVGLLKIELAKRGWSQGAIDGLISNYAGALNTLFSNEKKPYLSATTQKQIRDVMDVLHTYNDQNIGDRAISVARRAGALGLDSGALGFGKDESAGVIDDALKAGRQDTINRFTHRARATGGGDGGIYLDEPPGHVVTDQPPNKPAAPVPAAVQPASPAPTPTGQAGGVPPPGPTQPTLPQGAPGGGSPPVQPITVAGQQVTPTGMPPGASPTYVNSLQRIESSNEKNPWTASAPGTSAGGAYQFVKSTWAENKPAGAPNDPRKATPAQQTQALATLTTKNATALTSAGIPVNDVNLYVAHNLGAGGAAALLRADPNADARTVVGETAAKNNPLFFKGRPTVAQALARYKAEMTGSTDVEPPGPKPSGTGAMLSSVASTLAKGLVPVAGPAAAAFTSLPESAQKQITDTAVEHAPAIGGTVGAVVGGAAGNVPGAVAGGAVGSGAGQALKDYLQGNPQSPARIAEQSALGGVLGVMPEGRPILGAATRVLGAGAVEGGAEAARGGDTEDVTEAGLKGAGEAAGGELFGRALGMVGHKVWNLFNSSAKKSVQEAAQAYHEATQTLATEEPKIAGANGAASAPNPKYEAAEAAKTKAETTLKDAGLDPEEAAYAHKVTSEGVSTREAQVMQPADKERQTISQGYDKLREAVGQAGVGAPKATPKLADGPIAAVENKQVSSKHTELAQHVEAAITAPAKSWQDKWTQLQDARSQLLQAERDALASTESGKSKTAADMRTLANTVRVQQQKAAEYVFGKQDGGKFMSWLNVLDTRYRNLMEATNGMDFQKMASTMKQNTAASRSLDQKFKAAFAHDPVALKAWDSLRKYSDPEATVPWTVAAEGIPVLGKGVKAIKLFGLLTNALREQAAGNPAKFADMLRQPGFLESNQPVRDITGQAGARLAVGQ